MGSHQAFLGHGLEGVYILCDQMIDAFESFSALSSCLLFFCYLFIIFITAAIITSSGGGGNSSK
jgi:hypothetical protein